MLSFDQILIGQTIVRGVFTGEKCLAYLTFTECLLAVGSKPTDIISKGSFPSSVAKELLLDFSVV